MGSKETGRQDCDATEDVNAKCDASSASPSVSVLSYHIGGPNTSLPVFAESLLVCGLCLGCLAVSGYHYGKDVVLSSGWCFNIYRRARGIVRGVMGGWIGSLLTGKSLNITATDYNCGNEAAWIPLTTHSRAELDRKSPWERYLALLRVFEKCCPEVLTPLMPMENVYNERIVIHDSTDNFLSLKCNADAALIRILRRDSVCRRLASLAMRPYDANKFTSTSGASVNHPPNHDRTATTTLLRQFPHNRLLQRLSKLWKQLLVLPSLEECKSYYRLPNANATPVAAARNKVHANTSNYPYRISLILPAYHEKGSHLLIKLTRALELARDPHLVEVVIVDAGGCSDLEMALSLAGNDDEGEGGSINHFWGQVAIFSFVSGGGRGPCQNFGASVATGRILTFCHSDTTMPYHWDEKIMTTLEHGGMLDDELSMNGIARAHSCAFSFGVDTSPEGLSMPFESSTKEYHPPGIRAVEAITYVRNRLFSMPYGDQVISLHARVFDFIGGFPDQCLMEDYDLMSLLRKRAALFTPPSAGHGGNTKEKVALIPGAPSRCSPRRWQKFGVLYVTFMNHKFVHLYSGARQMSPDALFRLYYGREPPKRDADNSPWEVELAKLLDS